MSAPVDNPRNLSCCGALPRARSIKFLAALAAFAIIAVSLYASQGLRGPTPSASPIMAVKTPEQKDADKAAAQAANAVAAGKAFLDSLDATQRAKATFDFSSTKKSGWSNLPITNVPRNGVRMGDLNKAQSEAAMHLLAAVLSKEGHQKVIDIMNADEQLAQKGGGKGGGKGGKTSFGNDNYFLALFGAPSLTAPWMVQFGGHHLGLNVTVIEKSVVLTPTHTGTQPAVFTRDGKSVRPLGGENDAAFKLIGALDDKQRAQAILKDKVKEMILGPGKDGKKINPQGVKGSDLTAAQQAMLVDIAKEWISILPNDAAAARMADIKAKIADTYFAWSGPTTNGSAAYFRVHGPTVVIEYATQGTIDHIHTVVRDPTNDYGQALIKQ